MSFTSFRNTVWRYYRAHGRHDLPWRETRDPYKILVSEVMLQQTQVERVIPFYAEFTKRYPTARKLAAAPLADVLALWSGLGYNRRAKMLREAAAALAQKRGPLSVAELEALPGVGPYTARAVAAFAYNNPSAFVETNIRTAVIHHFFKTRERVSDKEIEVVLQRAAPDAALAKSGEWYWALMDYGAHLKRSGVRVNARSAHYAKQSAFAGSLREARGAVLRELAKGPRPESRLLGLKGDDRTEQLRAALSALAKEGMITKKGRGWMIA
ncbi:A/G-specific adenine glycosylase [Patescibacteria group bacterium]|nr:A/G-specific adenine glycosylase [Patescibacteria group bacterium]